MTEWLGIGLFVAAVLVVVMVHESGHFALAKAFGMKVEEFFVGFGPRLWSTRRGFFGTGWGAPGHPRSETEYGIKAIPAGGYVRIAGMNPFQEDRPQDLGRTFGAKPIWQRAVVIFAGPFTHFLMALVFLSIYYVAVGAKSEARPVIASVQATLDGRPSPAAQAGLRPGDRVVAIDGRPVGSIDRFISFTRAHVGRTVSLVVDRGGRPVTLRAVPVLSTVDGKQVGRLGVSLDGGRQRVGPLTGVGRAAQVTGLATADTVRALGQVFGPTGLRRIGQLLAGTTPRRATDAGSIVGGARLAGEAVRSGNWDFFFNELVLLNIFVGILNLVPLPPLDGGHLAVLVYEKARRRRPDLRKLVPLAAVVFAFIVLVGLSLAYIDITNPLPNPFR